MSYAVACLSAAVIAGFVLAVFAALGAFVDKFAAVLWPLALAVAASFVLEPAVAWVSRRLHVNKTVSCAIIGAVVCVLLAAVLYFAVPKICGELAAMAGAFADFLRSPAFAGSDTADYLHKLVETAKRAVVEHSGNGALLGAARSAIGAAGSATGGVVSFFAVLAAYAVTPIYLYYILSGNFDFFAFLERKLAFVNAGVRADILFFARTFADIMTSFFRGQILVAFCTGLVMGFGLMLCGVKFGFVLGFAAGLVNVIPYLGTIAGLSAVLPTAFFQTGGGLWLACLALCVFVLAQMFEAYFLTPKIMGNRTGLHPAVIIFSVFFWGVALNGILGMFLAVPLTAFFVAAWGRLECKLYKKEDGTR